MLCSDAYQGLRLQYASALSSQQQRLFLLFNTFEEGFSKNGDCTCRSLAE